jgi:hypothetical protein
VSGFVGSLLQQPDVPEVRILRTSREGQTGEIEFELLVVVAPGSERT